MAIQTGAIKIEGVIGDLSFYRIGDKYYVRRKGGASAKRIHNDPKCVRSRENTKEFGTASKAGKLLRLSFRTLVQHASNQGMYQRLVPEMLKIVKSDTINIRGDRTVFNGTPELLQGFEFNINHKLSTTMYAPYQYDFNRSTGVVSVSIPSFIPANMITAPDSATYFTITAGAAELDFQANRFVADTKKTGQLPFNSLPTDEIKMELNIRPTSTLPVFVVMGIEFYEQVDGVMQMLERDHNSLALVGVSSN